MNKTEAKRFVYRSVAESCRKYAARLKTSDIGAKAKQKDVPKVRAELIKVAEQFETKELRLASKRGTQRPEEGQDDIPEIRGQTRFGDQAAAAGVDEQQAGEG